MLAETHIHSQCEVSSFGVDNCDETVLGIDATKGVLKITGLSPSLSSYAAKEQTQMEAAGRRLGGEGPPNVGIDWLLVRVIFPSHRNIKSSVHHGEKYMDTHTHAYIGPNSQYGLSISGKIFCY